MRPSIALIVLACLAAGCVEPSPGPAAARPFAAALAENMAKLRADFSAFQPNSPQRDSACRRLVWSMLAMPTDDAQQQELSDRFAAVLAASDEFQMYDGNIMLMGSQVMKDYPPADRSYLMALANKVDSAREPDTPEAYQTTYSSVAVGVIVESVDYPRRVDTYDDRVDYDQWDRLRTWLDDNLAKLQMDPLDKRYRLPGAPAPQARPGLPANDPGR